MPRRRKGPAVVQDEPPIIIQASPWGRWSREHVRVEGPSARVTEPKGEYLVLGRVPRTRGEHCWEVTLRKKQPGTPLSIGIAINIKEEELHRGAQDTHFQDRIWHYGNTDGAFRNGGRQVPAADQKNKLAYATGDRITMRFDVESGVLTFAKNGTILEGQIQNVAYTDEQFAIFKEANPNGTPEFSLIVSFGTGDHVDVEESPYELKYEHPEVTCKWDSQIVPNTPSCAAGTLPYGYEVNRPLPPGVELDPNTGIISGVPTGRTKIDMNSWRDLCFQMYKGKVGEQGWKKARSALLKQLGVGLDPDTLRQRARELFERYDSDGSGEIDFNELKSAMASLNVILSDQELLHMAAELDVDGNAEIGVLEFEEMMHRMYNSKEKYGTWKTAGFALIKKLGTGLDVEFQLPIRCREIFNEFDSDGSGKIGMDELQEGMLSVGVHLTSEEVIQMIDEAGIDQGDDDPGLDFQSWKNLVSNIYIGADDSVWDKARSGIINMLGANLTDEELWDRTEAVFKELDEDGSGELDLEELRMATKKIGLSLQDDELSRMMEEADVNGRLWTVTVSNRLGEWKYTLKLVVLEGPSQLAYASTDVFCRVKDKFQPLKVGRLRGAGPFTFSVDPKLPEGMEIDKDTGTVMGRPTEESDKTEFTVTAANLVGSTQGRFLFQSLREPARLEYSYPRTIYKEGQLKFGAWAAARNALLDRLGLHVTDTTLADTALKLFQTFDADGSGEIDREELGRALGKLGVVLADEEVAEMIVEATGSVEVEVIGFETFLEVVQQIYYGVKAGADRFKIDPLGDWQTNQNEVARLDGTPPFIFTVSPPLPTGLQIDRGTGTIKGVPQTATAFGQYVVRVSNRVGEVKRTISIEVLEPPSRLIYKASAEELRLPAHIPMVNLRCTVEGTRKAQCGAMTFSAGRDPEQAQRMFQELDEDGSGELDEEEVQKMLSGMGITTSAEEAAEVMRGMMSRGGGAAALTRQESDLRRQGSAGSAGSVPVAAASEHGVTFDMFWRSISVGLPRGIVIDAETGLINGVPECEAVPGVYVISAWNPVGEVSTSIKIEVQEPPLDLRYTHVDSLYILGHPEGYVRLPSEEVDELTLMERGESFTENAVTWKGSKVIFSIYPPLPKGMSIDPQNGVISGSPMEETRKMGAPGYTEAKKFVISGKNDVATSTTEILIEVTRAPSVIKYFRHELVFAIGEEIRDNEVVLCDGSRPWSFSVMRDPEQAQATFAKYDVDGGGSLDTDEFRRFLRDLGEKMSEKEFVWLMSQIDSDKSGQIEYREFWNWWRPLPFGLEMEEQTGSVYGRPLRRTEPGTWLITMHNKVGQLSTRLKIHVLDEWSSRDREAEKRRQFWYTGARLMRYPCGAEYKGDFVNGVYSGYGEYAGADGYVCAGMWRRGKRHGLCKEKFPDGMQFEGEYVDGVRSGLGRLEWADGSVYEGGFVEGQRAGRGRQRWKDADGEEYEYDGEWADDVRHGDAARVREHGEGATVDCRFGATVRRFPDVRARHAFSFADASRYEGETLPSDEDPQAVVLHGEGRREWRNGDVYEGEFRKGRREGRGVFEWADGVRYEGQWKEGAMHGAGVLRVADHGFATFHHQGVRTSAAPVARLPLISSSAHTLGLSRSSHMLATSSSSQAPNATFEALLPPPPASMLVGYKDGVRVSRDYLANARAHSVLSFAPSPGAGGGLLEPGGAKAARRLPPHSANRSATRKRSSDSRHPHPARMSPSLASRGT